MYECVYLCVYLCVLCDKSLYNECMMHVYIMYIRVCVSVCVHMGEHVRLCSNVHACVLVCACQCV